MSDGFFFLLATIAAVAFAASVYTVVGTARYRAAARRQERAGANRLWGPAGIPALPRSQAVPGQQPGEREPAAR